jgi:hypothetical protein
MQKLLRCLLPLFLLFVAVPSLAAPGKGLLYATTRALDFISINPATGAPTLVGNTGVGPLPALGVSPATGIIYAGQGQGTPLVYTVNPGTGALTLVGDSGLGFSAISSMDFGPGNALYASVNIVGDGSTGGDNLATINPGTGIATVIGPYGGCFGGACTLEGMEAIAFDASGTLYGTTSNGTAPPALYTINTATGQATLVANLSTPPPGVLGGGISALAFGCDGTLYAGTARSGTLSTDGGTLGTLNQLTGVFTPIGHTIVNGSSLLDLAFQIPCPPVHTRGSKWGRLKTMYR